jgi:phosphoribosylformylglycinamidine synthase
MASSFEEFLAFAGSPAYSPFRLAELKDSLNASLLSVPKVTEVHSIYVHYVCPKSGAAAAKLKQPDSEERSILDQLLLHGDFKSELTRDAETQLLGKIGDAGATESGKLLCVVPRKGTISPWSSKATSIAHVCGLEKEVQRIERGVLFSLVFDGQHKNPQGPYLFADILHDRMTQVSSTVGQNCTAYS